MGAGKARAGEKSGNTKHGVSIYHFYGDTRE